MYAGYQTLLGSVGLTFDDLDRIIMAGNFGAFIDLERAICIGLLPDVDRDKFYYLGNASMLGCQISLSDVKRFRERVTVRQLITNLELSENPEFMTYYMASLFLPHTDMGLFPRFVKSWPNKHCRCRKKPPHRRRKGHNLLIFRNMQQAYLTFYEAIKH